MSDRGTEKALQEFLSEAQEIVEAFNRGLLRLDQDRASGRFDPEALNDSFRAVHSLKSLAGLFGLTKMTGLAHTLESLLDALRLGKLELTPEVLDILFETVEEFHRLVAEAGAGTSSTSEIERAAVEDLVERIEQIAFKKEPAVAGSPWGGYDLDSNLLSVLTEYEEHRLRENIKQGRTLYRIHASFDLISIDKGLEELKGRLKPVGEVITYLPSTESGDPDKIDLDVILGAAASHEVVTDAVKGLPVALREVPRVNPRRDKEKPQRAGAKTQPQPQEVKAPIAVQPQPASVHTPAPSLPAQPKSGAKAQLPAQVVVSKDEVRATPAISVRPPSGPSGHAGQPGHFGQPGSGNPGIAADTRDPQNAAAPIDHDDLLEDRPVSSLRSVSQTVRVDIRKLDHLLNVVGELSLVKAGVQAILDGLKLDKTHLDLTRNLHREVRTLGRKLDELQSGILEVRMVPLGQVFDKLSRVVRKISRDSGKEIRFVISGAETELDKLIVEELSDPLMHVIRNCIDHGIEVAEARRKAGKPEAGTIAIAAAQRGNHVVIVVEDDGGGLDTEKLIRKAIDRGYLDENLARDLGRRETYNLMFLPGVSTKDVPDEISGRGVGMDVVKTNIARLSGIIDVDSELGHGTRITLTLPITLAIIQALIIRAANRTYAVPLNAVLESLLIGPEELHTIERRVVLALRGSTLPILRLEDAFRLTREDPRPKKLYVVVIGMAQHRIGLIVDELVGQQDIVIKSLGKALDGVPGIAGATELGNQQTVLVLDVAALVEETLQGTMEAA